MGKFISVFGFPVAYYGIIMGCAILLGLFLAEREAKRTGQNPDTYTDLVIYAIVVSIICARAYYVIFSWDNYKDNLLSIFNLRQGGIAIYGAVIGAVLTVFVYSRVKKQSFALMLDTACIGLVAGQILGRWGNFFNREAFGGYTDGLFAMQLPVSAVRAHEITEQMWETCADHRRRAVYTGTSDFFVRVTLESGRDLFSLLVPDAKKISR